MSTPSAAAAKTHAGATTPPIQYDLCVIGGLGRAGLPLSLAFACHQQRVLIYDINDQAGARLMSGEMPFLEEDGDKFLSQALQSGNLFVSHDIREISKAAVLVVIIGTPVDDHLNPELDKMMDFLRQIYPYVHDSQIVMMRSTVFPGTTELVRDFFRKNGKNIRVTFCPERIAEGKAFHELSTLPQIISGFSTEDVAAMRSLFSHICAETIELSPMEAELGKLFTNVWRYCQFAVSNQFYMIANEYNMDFYRIYNAITHNYSRLKGMPAPGFAAGPCLFKDTLQLAAFNNNVFGLGYAAMTTNEGLPSHLVDRLKKKITLKDKTVGILGMAFKANSDDKRGSLSYKLRRVLLWEANEVLCTDVYLKDEDFLSLEEVVKRSQVIFLATPHKEYTQVDLSGKIVVDVWNLYGNGGLIKL